MRTKKLTNLSYLRQATGGEAQIMKEFIEMFFDQIPKIRKDLRVCLENERWDELGNLARIAKTSVMTFGLIDLSRQLSNFHLKTYKKIGINSYPAYVEEFETVTTQAEEELKHELLRLNGYRMKRENAIA